MKRLTFLTLLLLAVLGCTVGPDYRRPDLEVPAEIRGGSTEPAVEAGGAAGESLADRTWWELFEDEALLSLIDEALRQSPEAELAAWRVEEARALSGIAGAARWPAIEGGAGWSRGRSSEIVDPTGETRDLYDVGVGFAWEVDLWGRLRRLDEAARARYLATEEARRAVHLSLVSEVATSYFRLRTLDLQLEIARRTAEAFQETSDLFGHRLDAGLASGLETASAEASLAGTLASIPDLERRIVAEENRLSVLLGRSPGEIVRGETLDAQPMPLELPVGIPTDLLRRRPDLRRAEQELIAANAEVGVAVAELFPSLRLTGSFGGLAPEVSDLFGAGKTWSLGGGLLSPVFQGRRLQNQRRAAEARWEQARVRYEADVNEAFAEVSTAIVAYASLADAQREIERAVDSHREAVRVAGSRYRSGLGNYLEVLDAQRQLLPAENALAALRFERLEVLVELYRALGGGWNLEADGWARPVLTAAANP